MAEASSTGGQPEVGHPVSMIASLALLGSMAPRAFKTKRVWPAGVLAGAGAASSAYHLKKTLEWWEELTLRTGVKGAIE
jgi:uncharacterized membrane protein (UPF0136 family)